MLKSLFFSLSLKDPGSGFQGFHRVSAGGMDDLLTRPMLKSMELLIQILPTKCVAETINPVSYHRSYTNQP